jgi:hypothetical protein
VASFSWLLSLLVAGTLIRLLGAIFTRAERALDERIVQVVRGPVRLALTVLAISFGRRFLALDIPFQGLLGLLEHLVFVVSMAWLLFRLTDLATLRLRVRAEHRGNLGLLPALAPLQRFAKVTIAAFGLLLLVRGELTFYVARKTGVTHNRARQGLDVWPIRRPAQS